LRAVRPGRPGGLRDHQSATADATESPRHGTAPCDGGDAPAYAATPGGAGSTGVARAPGQAPPELGPGRRVRGPPLHTRAPEKDVVTVSNRGGAVRCTVRGGHRAAGWRGVRCRDT